MVPRADLSSSQQSPDQLDRLLSRRASLNDLYRLSIQYRQYSSDLLRRVPAMKSHRLIGKIAERSSELLGDPCLGERVFRQLTQLPLVSFADHAGILNHRLLYHANLLYTGMMLDAGLPASVVLATGRVPLDNISHPRGFFFAGRKYHFFPSKYHRVPVSLLLSGIGSSIARTQSADTADIARFLGASDLSALGKDERAFLSKLLCDSAGLGSPAHDGDPFHVQITRINHRLWPYYFEAQARKYIPDLVYLTADPLIAGLIEEDVRDSSSLISRILFDGAYRNPILEELDGIPGCWTEPRYDLTEPEPQPGNDDGKPQRSHGTHFFWGVDSGSRLFPLRIDNAGKTLRGESDIVIPLEPDAIATGLRTRTIVPGLFLDIFMLSYVEGLTLLGGFNQIEYASSMKRGILKVCERLGRSDLRDRFSTVIPDAFVCGPTPLSYQSGPDLIYSRNSAIYGGFDRNLAGGLSLSELESIMTMPLRDLISCGITAMSSAID